MDYGDFKDLAKIITSHKVLRDKAFDIAKNPKYDRYQRDLAFMVCKFFDKKTSGGAIKSPCQINNLQMNFINQLLKKNNKKTVYSSFKDYIWGTDLADMQLIIKFNKGIHYLVCIIDIFNKYAWSFV